MKSRHGACTGAVETWETILYEDLRLKSDPKCGSCELDYQYLM